MEERRRSQRLPLAISVKVYGRTPRNRPFRDETATMTVSLNGGLLQMKPRVKVGQNLLIVNSFTEEERLCRVVSIDARPRGAKSVAVEFSQSDGDFWHVYGPRVALRPVPQTASAKEAVLAEAIPAAKR